MVSCDENAMDHSQLDLIETVVEGACWDDDFAECHRSVDQDWSGAVRIALEHGPSLQS